MLLSGCQRVARPQYRPLYSLADYGTFDKYFFWTTSPDGKRLLINSRPMAYQASTANDRFKLLEASLTGGDSRVLVGLDTMTAEGIAYLPDNRSVLFLSVSPSLYDPSLLLRRADGSIQPVETSNLEHIKPLGYTCYYDTTIVLRASPRGSSNTNLYCISLNTLRITQLYSNDSLFYLGPVSRNRALITVARMKSNAVNEAFIFDRRKATYIPIAEPGSAAITEPVDFGPGDSTLLYLTNQNSDFMYLMRLHIPTGRREVVHRANGSVLAAQYSPSYRYISIQTMEAGRPEGILLDARTLKPQPLPEAPVAGTRPVLVTLAHQEKQMIIGYAGASSPTVIWAAENGRLTHKLTEPFRHPFNCNELAAPESRYFPSFDGEKIQAFVYRPTWTPVGTRHPAVIMVHPGPNGLAYESYQPFLQYLVSKGFVVAEINHRGSGGFGRRFADLDNQRQGIDDTRDIMALRHHLIQEGLVDSTRLGLMGTRYGGFLVESALTTFPDAFAAGVDNFGFTDLLDFLENPPNYVSSDRKALYAEFGDPRLQRDAILARSPQYATARIKAPILLIRGGTGSKSSRDCTQQYVQALRSRQIPVRLITFEDEGYGIFKVQNLGISYDAISNFLEEYLLKPRTSPLAQNPSRPDSMPTLTAGH